MRRACARVVVSACVFRVSAPSTAVRGAVCTAFLGRVMEGMKPANRKDTDKIETALGKECVKKDLQAKDKKLVCVLCARPRVSRRLCACALLWPWSAGSSGRNYSRLQCYFVDGAASMKRDLSKPLANGVPHEKICQRVSKSTPEMCQLRFCEAPPPHLCVCVCV